MTLSQLVTSLASDPERRRAVEADPEGELRRLGVSDEDVAALKSGDEGAIRRRLSADEIETLRALAADVHAMSPWPWPWPWPWYKGR